VQTGARRVIVTTQGTPPGAAEPGHERLALTTRVRRKA